MNYLFKKGVSTPPPSPSVPTTRSDLHERVLLLQQHHKELVQHTSTELEQLRAELEQGQLVQDSSLLNEVEQLRAEVQRKDQQLDSLQQLTAMQRQEMEQFLTQFKVSVESQLRTMHRQLQSLSLEALQGIEAVLDNLESAHLPQNTIPAPIVHAATSPILVPEKIRETPLPMKVKEEPKELVTVKKRLSPKKIALRSLSLIAVIALLVVGWNKYTAYSTKAIAGVVAGVSTDDSITTPHSTPAYAESQATVSIEETTWRDYTDPLFGINVSYPTNATNVVTQAGSSNIFFLRKGAYMLKVTKAQPDDANQWIEQFKKDYASDYVFAKGSLGNGAGWIGTPKEHSDTSGTMYLLTSPFKTAPAVFEVWAKDTDPTSDDGKRIAKMLASFKLITQ